MLENGPTIESVTDDQERRYELVPGHEELDPWETWPREKHPFGRHPYYIAKENAEDFEAEQERLIDELLPKSIALGDDVDDEGKLNKYHAHRIAEQAIGRRFVGDVMRRAKSLGQFDISDRIYRRGQKMLSCRLSGPTGFDSNGNVVVAWDDKCGLTKYCPDESLKEAKRIGEWSLPLIQEHKRQGGRVYKAWMTLPNYPGGRLREGVRYLPRRFRNRIMRAQKDGDRALPIDGALLIVEAPKSAQDDWNVHANVILLTSKWLDFKALRDAWGFNVEIREHHDFSDQGMAGMYNEMIKYSCRALPEKSLDDKHRNQAPPMIAWTADELIEWDCAMHGYRRTRSYGTLYGAEKPEVEPGRIHRWLARLEHSEKGYTIVRRTHDLQMHVQMMLRSEHFDLDLIRGNKSTTENGGSDPTRGPP